MTRALIIHPGGVMPEVRDLDGYHGLRDAVGGDIEHIRTPPHLERRYPGKLTLWGNEEGKLLNLPINAEATKLTADSTFWGDFFRGPLVIVGDDGEGGDTDVPESVVKAFLDRWDRMKFPVPLGTDAMGIVVTDFDGLPIPKEGK